MTVEPGQLTSQHGEQVGARHRHGVDADQFVPELGTDGTLTEEPYAPSSATKPAERASAIGEVFVMYAVSVAIALGLSAAR